MNHHPTCLEGLALCAEVERLDPALANQLRSAFVRLVPIEDFAEETIEESCGLYTATHEAIERGEVIPFAMPRRARG